MVAVVLGKFALLSQFINGSLEPRHDCGPIIQLAGFSDWSAKKNGENTIFIIDNSYGGTRRWWVSVWDKKRKQNRYHPSQWTTSMPSRSTSSSFHKCFSFSESRRFPVNPVEVTCISASDASSVMRGSGNSRKVEECKPVGPRISAST